MGIQAATRRPIFSAVATGLLTFALLAAIQARVPRAMLLADRFLPGAGWIEALALAVYAAVIRDRLEDPRRSGTWRRRVWVLFSAVFFGQFLLGILGIDAMLMTGRLHVPVPAVIVGGPLFRGERFFMPILFASTLVLVGPAWCSHLCYFGGWDNLAAMARKRPGPLPSWRWRAQPTMLALVILGALGMRWTGVPGAVAAMAAVAFGVAGIGVMALVSRRRGYLAHCTLFCPIGWIATRLGRRVSPFRIRIAGGCDGCMACATACRFGALSREDIAARQAGPSCTLCGDCIRPCARRVIGYRLGPLDPARARSVFLVLVVSIHAVFLGVARI
ncbi:4Fe-4S binding protein [Myxococcota bacterium]|jgi:polyferredoxin|nr:4Fe-4S binding protein [Myxococcota bacterium]